MSPVLDGHPVSASAPAPALAADTALAREWLSAGVELLLSALAQLEDADRNLRWVETLHVHPMAPSDRENLGRARTELAEARQAVSTMHRGLAELRSCLLLRKEVRR